MVDDLSDDDFKQALNKVADKSPSTGQYELLKNYYKELDVWSFNYDSEEDRQLVIDNAIKQYDRLRIPQNDDEWERLKPIDQRGDGKSLSKVQARIAQGPIPRTPKISVSNADSGRDTPGPEVEELSNKTLAKVKNDTKRSSSQPPNNTTKPKRLSEKEAQSKRLLSTKKKPTVTAASSVKKESPTKASAAKPLSNQFVTESDDEEASKPLPPTKRPSPAPKRPREDEASSDSSQPLMKKVRPSYSKPVEHRTSDAQYSQSSSSTFKSKGTSPQKSSPLASSPPTNASDFASSASSSASDASTPRHHTSIGSKIPRSPIHKRNASSSSLSTNSSTSSTMGNYTKINPNVMQLAAKFRCYYPTYAALHRELSGSKESERDISKHEKLLHMHERLVQMKKEIKEASLRLT
jgi:RNA polymerase II elongation factor ELL